MKTKSWIILAAGTAAIVGGALWARRHWPADGAAAASYTPIAFTREHLEIAIESTGLVEPRNRLEIKPPLAGRIEETLVTEGQEVKQGDIVARMSSTERATLLDAARTKGPAMLQKWADAYQPTPLIAPLTGTIIARNIEPGQTVDSSDVVLVMSDQLIVTAQVDETDIGQIHLGQSAAISLDAYPAVRVKGTARHIAYEAVTVNNVTIYEVEVDLEQIPECMKSGMTATVKFAVAACDDALTLPADAVLAAGDRQTVLVQADPARPPERWRVLTGLAAGGRVEILAGLDGSETVLRPDFTLPTAGASGSSPLMPGPRKR